MAGLFLTIVQISSEFVGGQCASWRLPPKAAVSAYRRHSFVEGIRNGGLDFVKAAVGVFKAWRLSAERRLFSFAVARQIISYLPSNTILEKSTLQLSKIPWIFKLKNLSLLVNKNHIVTEIRNQIKVMG